LYFLFYYHFMMNKDVYKYQRQLLGLLLSA